MKKHKRARLLTIVVSTYLYSENSVPKRLNEIFLRFCERGEVPNERDVKYLFDRLDASYRHEFKTTTTKGG